MTTLHVKNGDSTESAGLWSAGQAARQQTLGRGLKRCFDLASVETGRRCAGRCGRYR